MGNKILRAFPWTTPVVLVLFPLLGLHPIFPDWLRVLSMLIFFLLHIAVPILLFWAYYVTFSKLVPFKMAHPSFIAYVGNGAVQGLVSGSFILVIILALYSMQLVQNQFGQGDGAGALLVFAALPYIFFVWPFFFLGGLITGAIRYVLAKRKLKKPS